jgi:hypothetical protein
MVDLRAAIERAVKVHFPNHRLQAIYDRGEWVRRIIKVILDTGEAVYFKLDLPHEEPGWLQVKEGECHERDVAQILEQHTLHVVPPVLVVDHSCEIIPYPYIIKVDVGGRRLGDLLERVSEPDIEKINETVGEFYRSLHAIHNDQVGLWNGSTPDEPWGDPTGYLYQAEVVEGSGKRALTLGNIPHRTYERAVALWGDGFLFGAQNYPQPGLGSAGAG